MSNVKKTGIGITLLIIGEFVSLFCALLAFLCFSFFTDYFRNFDILLFFYSILSFLGIISSVLLLAGFASFFREFKQHLSYTSTGLKLLMIASILYTIYWILQLFWREITFFMIFWLRLITFYIMPSVFSLLFLIGYILLQREFTEHAGYVRAVQTPTYQFTPQIKSAAMLRFCPYCGSQVFPEASFCQVCGKKLK